MKFNSETITQLKNSKMFQICSNIDLARIAPYITEISVFGGEALFKTGDLAENLYLIIDGEIEIQSGKRVLNRINQGSVGEEAVGRKGKYLTTAMVLKDSRLLKIPKQQLMDLIESYPEMKDEVYSSLVNHHAYIKIDDSAFEKKARKKEDQGYIAIVGWILAIILPVLVFCYGDRLVPDWKSKVFLTVVSSTIIMWIFRLAHEFIPTILSVIVILILDIAPAEVALSGFTSGSFFMALSIFGISAVLISSGLTYRLVINLFRFLPLSQFWHSFAIFITGIFLTPLLPSANGRVSLASPILIDMVESLGYSKCGRAATRLAVATLAGFTMFSSIFLSSKAIHFIIFGLLPPQVREQFGWIYWLYAAGVAGIVMLVFYFIITQIMFSNRERPGLSMEIIRAQHDVLGPLSSKEWAALGGILLFAVGIATSSIHKIELPWIGFTVLYVVLAFGYLSKKDFRINIDWTFLVYLGTLIGLVRTMSYIGLDKVLGQHFIWLGHYMKDNFGLFVFLITLSTMVLRIFVPNNATVAILASVLFPISVLSGVNPWVIGFIILMMSDMWMMPYQSTYYLLFDELTSDRKLFNKSLIMKFNIISIIFRVIAVYASIPFWRSIGIL